MTGRSRWIIGTVAYAVINVGGLGYALAMGELTHAGVHLALIVVGAFVLLRYSPWARREQIAEARVDPRLDHLQQSVDAIALQVERIGEAQRYIAKRAAEHAAGAAPQQKPASQRKP